jgi:hypothetical protein
VPANPPTAPAKTKKKTPKKKKTSVAAAAAAAPSLDAATLRLQQAIATPGQSPAPPKPQAGASGKSTKSKGLPDGGPLKD